VRAYKSWPSWKPDAPAEAWLHRIALNAAFSYLRWRKLRQVGDLLARFGTPPATQAPSPELQGDLWRALRQLPPRQAALVILRHYHGYSNREIAFALRLPESTVSSRLAAAKAQLRRELGDVDVEAPQRAARAVAENAPAGMGTTPQ
jgi:RNA polymerase sigma factor (sigma-70 family)